MTDSTNQRHPRRTTAIIVAALVLVIAAVAAIGVLTAGGATRFSTPAPSASVGTGSSASATTTVSPTHSAPATPLNTRAPKPATTASSPQPTKTATISSAAPIRKSLTAEVTKMEAVQGTASGPGEVAGPAVRFTITITNGTGKRFDLSNTVVNAYSGSDAAPAIELQSPGAKAFPASVANDSKATGVFVFNIPKADRSKVEVTVDTSVIDPVIAFRGSAPR